jgi:hypothetical protein
VTNEVHEPYPEKDDRDFGYSVARASLGMVPYFGPPLTEIADLCVGMPLQKRRDQWFKKLHELLLEVRERFGNFDATKLSEDQEFITIVQRASDTVVRNHRSEKLEAAENIVFNAAAGFKIEEVLRDTFFSFLTDFHHNISSCFVY